MSTFSPNVFPRATAMVHEEHIYTYMHTHVDIYTYRCVDY